MRNHPSARFEAPTIDHLRVCTLKHQQAWVDLTLEVKGAVQRSIPTQALAPVTSMSGWGGGAIMSGKVFD